MKLRSGPRSGPAFFVVVIAQLVFVWFWARSLARSLSSRLSFNVQLGRRRSGRDTGAKRRRGQVTSTRLATTKQELSVSVSPSGFPRAHYWFSWSIIILVCFGSGCLGARMPGREHLDRQLVRMRALNLRACVRACVQGGIWWASSCASMTSRPRNLYGSFGSVCAPVARSVSVAVSPPSHPPLRASHAAVSSIHFSIKHKPRAQEESHCRWPHSSSLEYLSSPTHNERHCSQAR